jgi:adenylate cyclase
MTIRKKIFLLAGILLALFGVVVGVLAIIQKLDSDQIGNIVGYELPLSRIVAQFDVDTDRYELNILRVLRLDPASPVQIAAAVAGKQALTDEMRSDVVKAGKLLEQAIQDRSYNAAERVDLARVEGSFKYLSRSLEEFLTVGDRTMAALADGRREDARTASLDFANFAQAFGPDLSEIRRAVADLTERSTREVLAREELDAYLSFALFLAACGIGLGISAVGSTRVIAGLRQLVASARAIESGGDSQPVVIRSRDEVGELALSFNRMVEELRTRERIKETFGKFLDPRIVTRLIGNGANEAERRNLTVFFSDIKGFTGISEQLTAGAVVNLLNSYFGAIAAVIHEHHGVIDKYIGDAVMAFWTPPFSAGDSHASDACLAALAQQEAMVALRAQLPEITGMRRNPPKLVIRMGIATGEGVVGTIGSEAARSYTVIGDTVNLASRLESINKLYGTSIILSEETFRLAQQAIEARELDLITVAGKTEPVRIYEVMGRAGELNPEQSELRDRFACGLAAYRRRDWDEAQTHFESCLGTNMEDGPTQLFLERIAQLRNTPPPADWDAIWRLTEK